jgi:predicted dehydrogenase
MNLKAIYTNRNNNSYLTNTFNCKIFNNYKKILDINEIDAIYIASSNNLHFKLAKDAIIAKKNVLIEKPATINLYQAKVLSKLATKNKVALMEGFMYKFHRQFILLKEKIKNKNIIKIESTFGFPHLPKNNIRYLKKFGGGALLDAGCYTISSILSLLQNDIKIEKCSMQKKNYEVDIKGNATFITKSKLRCTAKWYFGGVYKNEIKVVTSDDTIIAIRAFSKPSDLKTVLNIYKGRNLIKSISVNEDNHFINMFNYFQTICFDKSKKITEINNILSQAKLVEKVRLLNTI